MPVQQDATRIETQEMYHRRLAIENLMLQYVAPQLEPVHTRHVIPHHPANICLKPAQYFDVSKTPNYPSFEQCVCHACEETVAVNSTEHCDQRYAMEVS
jgi:hypothetical protein